MSQLRKILVSDVYDPKKMHSLIVDEEEPIRAMARSFAEQPALRGIFVVDKEQRFKGVITRHDLLKWTKIEIGAGRASGPAAGRAGLT